MRRSPSPSCSTRSTSSNLIRSYTTSSDLPASEQLAAIAKAREERRKQREMFATRVTADGDSKEVNEVVQLQNTGGEGPQEATNDSSTTESLETTTLLPKLRVQPSSDRSFTPSIPSSPSKSSGEPAETTLATTQEDAISTPRPSSPLRNSFAISEIPPFRPKSSSPTNSSPISTPPLSCSNVVLSGGLLERLKAQRATQIAKSNTDSGSPSPSIYGSEGGNSNATASNGSAGGKDVDILSASSESVNEASTVEATNPPHDSPELVSELPRPASVASSVPESLPPLTNTSTNPSSFATLGKDEDEGGDAVSELSEMFTNRERTKSRSRIHGRYGEEVDYDFTALSDVPEKSERSSLSTMQGSLWRNHLRQNSLPTSETPASNRYSSSSNPTLVYSSSPVVQSRSSPSLTSTSSRSDPLLDRRVDATSHILGRSTSVPSSIFVSTNRSKSSSSAMPSEEVPRSPSPTRNTSPEIARRASRFELLSSPKKDTFPISDPARPASPPVERPLPALLFEDSLAEIEKRRLARRARLDSIRNLYSRPQTEETESAEKNLDEGDHWNEIERKEQEQVDRELSRRSLAATTKRNDLSAPFTNPVSPISHTFCEGYLSVPVNEDARLLSSHREDWMSRYSVLTSETLSFRPTDQNSLTEPIIVLNLVDCDRVEEYNTTSSIAGSSKPFSVVLKSGERKTFGCEKGSERVRWVLAIENAIRASHSTQPATLKVDEPQQSTRRVLASPSSQTPPTTANMKGQVVPTPIADRSRSAQDVHLTGEPQQPRARSVWSRPEPTSTIPLGITSPTLERSQALGTEATSPVVKPLSADLLSRFDERPLPKVPVSPRAQSQCHSRSRSDLSAYRTRDEEPPFRPSPTRPKSFHFRSKTEENLAASIHSDQSSLSGSSLTCQEVSRPAARSALKGTASRAFDAETITTRGGFDTASNNAEWSRTIVSYQHEARQFARTSSSSLVDSERKAGPTSSRHLESPTRGAIAVEAGAPVGKSGFRLAFGRKAVSNSLTPQDVGQSSTLPHSDPRLKSVTTQSHLSTPLMRFSGSRTESSSSDTQSSNTQVIEELLWTIRETLENQQSTHQDDKARQEMQAQAISALAKWVTEDTRVRQSQHDVLGRAVEDVVQQVANLPQQLLTVLENAILPEQDDTEVASDNEESDLLQADEQEATMEERDTAAQDAPKENRLKKKNSRRGLVINPLSSFAIAARNRAAQAENDVVKQSAVKPKGPRMPAIRVWGAPEPVADRSTRWGGARAALDSSTERALEDDVDARPVADQTEGVSSGGFEGGILHNDAQPESACEENVDGAELFGAVREILDTLRDLSQRQTEQANLAAEDRTKSQAITAAERTELEAKKAEISRVEQITSTNAERTAKINDMVAQLAQKANTTDQLLVDIAKSVKEGKRTTMDPALTAEVKKLLSDVQNGVNSHVTGFRGKLTSEVQRMFREVEKLRDEKKALQNEIAELMAFHAKYSASAKMQPQPRTASGVRDEPVLPTQDLPPKTKVSSFYGPRIMK